MKFVTDCWVTTSVNQKEIRILFTYLALVPLYVLNNTRDCGLRRKTKATIDRFKSKFNKKRKSKFNNIELRKIK